MVKLDSTPLNYGGQSVEHYTNPRRRLAEASPQHFHFLFLRASVEVELCAVLFASRPGVGNENSKNAQLELLVCRKTKGPRRRAFAAINFPRILKARSGRHRCPEISSSLFFVRFPGSLHSAKRRLVKVGRCRGRRYRSATEVLPGIKSGFELQRPVANLCLPPLFAFLVFPFRSILLRSFVFLKPFLDVSVGQSKKMIRFRFMVSVYVRKRFLSIVFPFFVLLLVC